MSTLTAQMLVGESHTYDGGIINIRHAMYLSENSVARWSLRTIDMQNKKNRVLRSYGWIPYHPNSILEDGLLLLGLYVWRDEKLIEMANQFFTRRYSSVNLLCEETITLENLRQLYDRNRIVLTSGKLILSIFEGSSLFHQLEVLDQYPIEIEVCKSVYNRQLNPWNGHMEIHGELKAKNNILRGED